MTQVKNQKIAQAHCGDYCNNPLRQTISPDVLFNDKDSSIISILMKWFIKGQNNIAITGGIGADKTNALLSLIGNIPNEQTIYADETISTRIAHYYPQKNVVSVDMEEITTFTEKCIRRLETDITDECTTDKQADYIIKRSKYNQQLFTHYAKTVHELIAFFSNSIMRMDIGCNKRFATRIASEVVNIGFCMSTIPNKRYCQRITEIVPASDTKRNIDYLVVILCEWKDGQYYMRNMPSDKTIEKIKNTLSEQEEKIFLEDMAFLESKLQREKL